MKLVKMNSCIYCSRDYATSDANWVWQRKQHRLFPCWAWSLLVFVRCEEEKQDSNKVVKLWGKLVHSIHLDEWVQTNCGRKRLLVFVVVLTLFCGKWHKVCSIWPATLMSTINTVLFGGLLIIVGHILKCSFLRNYVSVGVFGCTETTERYLL